LIGVEPEAPDRSEAGRDLDEAVNPKTDEATLPAKRPAPMERRPSRLL